MECAQTGYRMRRKETLCGLPWTVTPFALQANRKKMQRSNWERGCSPEGTSLGRWTDEVSVPGKLQVSSVRRDHIHLDEYG